MADIPVLFSRWEAFTGWVLNHTQKFPRRTRHTLANRIDNLLLDVYEALVEARYSRQRLPILKQINLELEKLRLFLRLAHTQRFLAHQSFAYACNELEEIGRMVGGWIKQQEPL